MELATCFELGRALRYGDAEAFFHVYDGLEKECGAVTQDQVDGVKELARQISELPHEDFSLLQTGFSTDQFIGCTCTDTDLPSLLERLRLDVYYSDSGAVSDFDSSMCDSSTRSRSSSIHSDTSVQTLHSFFTGTTEDSFSEESIQVPAEHGESTPCNVQGGNDKYTPTSCSGQSTVGPLKWNKDHPRGKNRRYNRKGRRSNSRNWSQPAHQQTHYSAPLQYGRSNRGRNYVRYHRTVESAVKDLKEPSEKSGNERQRFNHLEVAQFLWQGWLQVQKELNTAKDTGRWPNV